MYVPHATLSNGVRMPMLGLGTWNLRGMECTRAVRAAVELGYEHIDTAVQYDNHKEIGYAIRDTPRQRLFITTKIWRADLEYADVLRTWLMPHQQYWIASRTFHSGFRAIIASNCCSGCQVIYRSSTLGSAFVRATKPVGFWKSRQVPFMRLSQYWTAILRDCLVLMIGSEISCPPLELALGRF